MGGEAKTVEAAKEAMVAWAEDYRKYIRFGPNGSHKVSREYVESRAAWIQAYNSAGKWLVDKPRQV